MHKLLTALLIAALLLPFMASSAFAAEGAPLGGCPDSFELHQMGDHGDHAEHMHHHIGNDADQNGDGFICMKHVGVDGNNHVHIDNRRP